VLTPFLPLSQVHDNPLSLTNVSGGSASLTLPRVTVHFKWPGAFFFFFSDFLFVSGFLFYFFIY
jgi:hypothetical protein